MEVCDLLLVDCEALTLPPLDTFGLLKIVAVAVIVGSGVVERNSAAAVVVLSTRSLLLRFSALDRALGTRNVSLALG